MCNIPMLIHRAVCNIEVRRYVHVPCGPMLMGESELFAAHCNMLSTL